MERMQKAALIMTMGDHVIYGTYKKRYIPLRLFMGGTMSRKVINQLCPVADGVHLLKKVTSAL